MTTSMPSGDGTVTDSPTESAVDEEAAPATGLDPDTAPDAAGETDTSVAAGEDAPVAAGEDKPVAANAAPEREAAPVADRTVLDGPALQNPEMHRATEDLQSSEDKIADARQIADDLSAATRSGDV